MISIGKTMSNVGSALKSFNLSVVKMRSFSFFSVIISFMFIVWKANVSFFMTGWKSGRWENRKVQKCGQKKNREVRKNDQISPISTSSQLHLSSLSPPKWNLIFVTITKIQPKDYYRKYLITAGVGRWFGFPNPPRLMGNIMEAHLIPVAQLIEGQVQLQHVSADRRDVRPRSSFSDPGVAQDQSAGQEEAACRQPQHPPSNKHGAARQFTPSGNIQYLYRENLEDWAETQRLGRRGSFLGCTFHLKLGWRCEPLPHQRTNPSFHWSGRRNMKPKHRKTLTANDMMI